MITWQQKGTSTYYRTSLTNLLSAIDKSQNVAVNFIQKCRKLWAFQNDKMFDQTIFGYSWHMHYQVVLP